MKPSKPTLANSARRIVLSATLGALAVGFAGMVTASPARAQDPAAMSCQQLWYERNSIYARNGYCFRTARGQAAFGPGCFPPYGRLSGWEQNRVNELQYWERRRGCPM